MPSQLAISRDAAKLEGVCIMIDGERETVGLVSGELIHFGTRIVSPRIATERRERHCAGNDLPADAAIANPPIVAGQPACGPVTGGENQLAAHAQVFHLEGLRPGGEL